MCPHANQQKHIYIYLHISISPLLHIRSLSHVDLRFSLFANMIRFVPGLFLFLFFFRCRQNTANLMMNISLFDTHYSLEGIHAMEEKFLPNQKHNYQLPYGRINPSRPTQRQYFNPSPTPPRVTPTPRLYIYVIQNNGQKYLKKVTFWCQNLIKFQRRESTHEIYAPFMNTFNKLLTMF